MRSSPEIFCSREPPLLTQAGAVPRRRNGLAYFGPTGVQEQGAGTRGSLGNLRDPAVSVVTAGLESRLTNSRLIHSSVPSWWGRTGDERWYRQTKATKCGEMGDRESERPIVALRRGNSTEGPRGVKGMPFQMSVTTGSTSSGASYFAVEALIFALHMESPEGAPLSVKVGCSQIQHRLRA